MKLYISFGMKYIFSTTFTITDVLGWISCLNILERIYGGNIGFDKKWMNAGGNLQIWNTTQRI